MEASTLEPGAGIRISPGPTDPSANSISPLGMEALAASGLTFVMNERLGWPYLKDEVG